MKGQLDSFLDLGAAFNQSPCIILHVMYRGTEIVGRTARVGLWSLPVPKLVTFLISGRLNIGANELVKRLPS
jgi:hypothetical protein